MTLRSGWRPKMVALDIDGTLVDVEQQMSDVVDAAVRKAVASGVHVVLSTGRGLTSARPLAEHFELFAPYLVCSNGAVTVRLHLDGMSAGSRAPGSSSGGAARIPSESPDPNRITNRSAGNTSDGRAVGVVDENGVEMIDIVTFDPGPVLRMLLDRLPDALVAVEELGVGYRGNAPFPPGELTGEISIEPLERLIADPVTRVIVREPSIEVEHFLDVVDRVGLHGVSYYIGYTAWLDLAPEGVSKATGLAKVAERLGVAREDVLAIGDGNNDVEMLRWAGRGVAMANGAPEALEAADAVTASIEEDGVAVELSRWFD